VSELPDHVARNRADWDAHAKDWVQPGRRDWARDEPWWGIFTVPESQLHVLPDDLDGLDTIELGCGTGYVSAWLAKRGARPVGIDNSAGQLATARLLQAEFGIDFPLVHGNAEATPFDDESFDFAISEYGASIWCDPYRWIPEAARLLRVGGRLVFLVDTPLAIMCSPEIEGEPAGDRLLRPYFGMHRIDWGQDDAVEFHLPHGELIALLRASGFEIEELVEVRPPADATTRFAHATVEWARQWPYEEIWKVRKRG
jgi:SAM-dependent methyltransferase